MAEPTNEELAVLIESVAEIGVVTTSRRDTLRLAAQRLRSAGEWRDFIRQLARLTHSQDDGASLATDDDAHDTLDRLIGEAREFCAGMPPPVSKREG